MIIIEIIIKILFTSILLIPILLLIILISLLVLLFDGSPVFFSQRRLGYKKKIFRIYKFRTMTVDSEKKGTGLNSYEDDPRVTKLGRYLRKLSLDELPQFFNIIKFDMNYVGPRPPVEYELGDVSLFSDKINKRFNVKPGVTGYSQINGRNLLNWEKKIELDNIYIDKYNNYGIIIDFIILIKTIYVIFTMKGSIEKNNE